MDPQSDIENEKSLHWFKAGHGIKCLTEGIFPFCDSVVKQQHAEILKTIKTANGLSVVFCDECSLDSLLPSHKKDKNKKCPRGLTQCNCCKNTTGTRPCPNNVCGDIYDIILDNYGASPKPPYWTNTNAQAWCKDPWAIAKCFINIPGYQECEAKDIDATGLLSLIINNLYFHKNTNQSFDGSDPLSKVKVNRNKIFHSRSMELEKAVLDYYMDEMINALECLEELKMRDDAKAVVKKLRKLKQEDYIITPKIKLQVISDGIKAIMNESKNLDERVKSLESERREEQILKEFRKAHDYQQSKLDFQDRLINLYRSNTLKVNSMPFQTDDDYCDFQDIYVSPHIILKSNSDKRRDIEVSAMSDIFMRDENQVKSIFVLGEAGSGKTSFCLSLVNFWCLAHSPEETAENEFRGIREMKKFEFVFYVSLRHCQATLTIQEMIMKQYKDEIIDELLNKESDKLLIILDGLDEWAGSSFARDQLDQFQLKNTPVRDHLKDYPLIETARLRKIMTKNKSEQTVEIKGISKESFLHMIKKILSVIETRFEKKKDPTLCESDLEDICYEDIKCIPIMLQLLICLWYDNKLVDTSNSDLFTKIIMLYFEWHYKKNQETLSYNKMKLEMSKLAYQTLLNRKTSFTFGHTTDITKAIWELILNLGILTKEKGPNLCASEYPKDSYSFVHRSIQEFLCALHLSDYCMTTKTERCDIFLKEMSVLDLLDYANMLIFLFGLKPEMSETISSSIYEICANDTSIIAYREEKEYPSKHCQMVLDIQTFILSSVTEVRKCQNTLKPRFHLGDIVIDDTFICDKVFCTSLEEECVIPDTVLSVEINIKRDDENVYNIFKYLAKCGKLEKLCIQLSDDYPNESEEVDNIYASFDLNALYLKALFLSFKMKEKYSVISKTLIRQFPKMDRLIVINMEGVILEEDDCTMFCKFISEKTNLEMISLKMLFKCDTRQTLDLHRHQNLKYLSFDDAVNVAFANCLYLSIFKFSDINNTNFMRIFESLKSKPHLKELELRSSMSSIIFGQNHVENIPNSLGELLKSLTQLAILKLHNFDFTTSTLRVYPEMRHLEEIHMFDLKMSSESWDVFLDRLRLLPINSFRLYVKEEGDGR